MSPIFPQYFFLSFFIFSLFLSMFHHGSVRVSYSKECFFIFILHMLFWLFFVFSFFIKKFEVFNFCNRILTNKKLEQVISNCQWNCMICISNIVCSAYKFRTFQNISALGSMCHKRIWWLFCSICF